MPTTSQTKRLSVPAHVSHGKPSLLGEERGDERRLREPAEPHAPCREPPGATGVPGVAGVRERCLAVAEQRG